MNQTKTSYIPEESNFQILSHRNENYKSHITFKEHLLVVSYRDLFSLRVFAQNPTLYDVKNVECALNLSSNYHRYGHYFILPAITPPRET
jgi:hypothetical protein